MTKILDCTLRDGGYYTNWDFEKTLVDKYIKTINDLPVDYVEIGYRSPVKREYLGEYFYTPIETIDRIRGVLDSKVKLAIMINTKDIENIKELEYLLLDCSGKIDLIRFSVSSSNIQSAILFANKVKDLGFEVALNLMYLSQKDSEKIVNEVAYILENVKNIDFLYLVDSYGACLPTDIKDKFSTIRQRHEELALGFHGHDNIQLAYANSLEAIKAGVSIVDATITGMGRGAGNLCTEIICSYEAVNKNIELDYTNLVELVDRFNDLKVEYGWGTSIPYMISGFNKLPQGEVMNLISLKRYSTSSIVKIIENKIHNEVPKKTTKKVDELLNKGFEFGNYDFAVLVGGGTSVTTHFDGLKILNAKFNILIIHSTTKHIDIFLENGFDNLVCLPGDEIKKVKTTSISSNSLRFVISNDSENIDERLQTNYYSIGETDLDKWLDNTINMKDAPLLMSLKVTEVLNIQSFYLVGFDGYDIETATHKILRDENQAIIDCYSKMKSNLVSLTPSKYNIGVVSLYSLIVHGIEQNQ